MSRAAVKNNDWKTWTDWDKAELFKIVKRNARNNVSIEETWMFAGEVLGRKANTCKVAWNRFAPDRMKSLVEGHYEAHRNGTYRRPIEVIRERYAAQQVQIPAPEAPVALESVEAEASAQEIVQSIEEVSASLVLPVVSETNVEVTPLVKALAYIISQVGALESQMNRYKSLARSRKEEIEQLNSEKEELRSELKKARNRLAQVVKN